MENPAYRWRVSDLYHNGRFQRQLVKGRGRKCAGLYCVRSCPSPPAWANSPSTSYEMENPAYRWRVSDLYHNGRFQRQLVKGRGRKCAGLYCVRSCPSPPAWANSPSTSYEMENPAYRWRVLDLYHNGRFQHHSWSGVSTSQHCIKSLFHVHYSLLTNSTTGQSSTAASRVTFDLT